MTFEDLKIIVFALFGLFICFGILMALYVYFNNLAFIKIRADIKNLNDKLSIIDDNYRAGCRCIDYLNDTISDFQNRYVDDMKVINTKLLSNSKQHFSYKASFEKLFTKYVVLQDKIDKINDDLKE